jgi:hypothetical protein
VAGEEDVLAESPRESGFIKYVGLTAAEVRNYDRALADLGDDAVVDLLVVRVAIDPTRIVSAGFKRRLEAVLIKVV